MFENYKSVILLKYMKAIRKSPKQAQCSNSSKINHELQMNLFDAFIK